MTRRATSPTLLAALLALAPALAACHTAPSFAVTDVAMTDESDAGYVLSFTIEGTNEEKEELPLREIHYSLSLDGQHVFTGQRSAQATLPAGASQAITLPVAIPGPPPSDTADYRISGTVTYLLPGSIAELLFDNNIRRPNSTFAESGTFQFTD